MLILQRELHERILIGDDITIEVMAVRGGTVRLGIVAPASVRIDREEVRRAVERTKAARGGGAT